MVCVGVLALQGGFSEHIQMLNSCLNHLTSEETQEKFSFVEVRNKKALEKCDGLIIPGGESTAISRLLESFPIEVLREFVNTRMVFGTCAGAILLADRVVDRQRWWNLINPGMLSACDITIVRNYFGRQHQSSVSELNCICPEYSHLHQKKVAFIRAPAIMQVGPGVKAWATCGVDEDNQPVYAAAESDNVLVTVFHPELTGVPDFHLHFLRKILNKPAKRTIQILPN